MVAPSGGFAPVGSSFGHGMSVLVFQRTRHAVVGLKSIASDEADDASICRSGVMSSRIQKPRPCVAATRSSSFTTRSRTDEAAMFKRSKLGDELKGRSIALVFFNPSMRTRTRFEMGAFQLGGHAVVLQPGKDAWPIEFDLGTVMDGDTEEHIAEVAIPRRVPAGAEMFSAHAPCAGARWC